jgi:chaperonin cofactor prefoldin
VLNEFDKALQDLGRLHDQLLDEQKGACSDLQRQLDDAEDEVGVLKDQVKDLENEVQELKDPTI